MEGDIEEPISDNRFIGLFKIKGKDFDEGVITAGADLICEYEVLDSGNIIMEVSVPSIRGSFHSGRNYYSRQEGQIDYSKASKLVQEPRRETTDWVAQYEPGSQTVDITEKDNATEHRDLTPTVGKGNNPDHLGDANLAQEQILDDQVQGRRPVSEQEIAASFHQAEEITKTRLGADAVTAPAEKDSGIYRGEILGDTQHHVVQGVTAHIAVAHEKDSLAAVPAVGDQVRIMYSNSLAQVNPFALHVRAKALSR